MAEVEGYSSRSVHDEGTLLNRHGVVEMILSIETLTFNYLNVPSANFHSDIFKIK